jgi:hypothetical protein
MKDKYIAIIDQIGRNIIGKIVAENDNTITLHNPVIMFVQPEQTGQIQVQSFPVFFFEFIDKDTRENNNWTYHKSNIVISDVTLDARVLAQYEKINTPPAIQQQTAPDIKVVNIDDL